MNIENLQFVSKERIFMNEPVLVSIEIPENLQIINGKNIFKKDINKFIIPSSITKLDDWCFSYCSSLKSINIPSSICEIGTCCFYECSSLTTINIPSSITSIGKDCFYECSSLTSMNIENLQFVSKERIFMNEPVLISCEISYNLQIINGKNIFKKDINEFIIPSSITKLGYRCFSKCSTLKSINIPSSITKLGDECFSECTSLTSINIPSSISEIGDWCFYECYSLTTINIPSSISEIGTCCFYECSSLKSINIPSSITSFGNYCFYGCGCEEELKKNKTIPRKCFDKRY
ncbi:hypothetical protein, conserved [Entamoeba dispar SAW760]|uniref:Leucine rich repeat containing protein BspA family protein n=1 Tax=Entamoeba dispar (strain ATCC PRA-260 / SAW760) TaxID=370354 RepID=B0EBX1_ENTDS|nr:uncharacterized protein EDI_219720 [Entamoeba dispar SAW760]EDR27975.1 hypothetical protein, conserved [Entamoeba dispar SAW760]|eukprot:EDR27975.1 hypothetical protein, conserved [Entamoeba dispar SAW760]